MTVFVSYSHADLETIDKVLAAMPPKLAFWLDRNRLEVGEQVTERIRHQIEHESDLYLIFVSRNSLQSKWVRDEFAIALELEQRQHRKFIIPAVLDASALETQANTLTDYVRSVLYVKYDGASTIKVLAKQLSDAIFARYVLEFKGLRTNLYTTEANERVRVFTDRNKLPPFHDVLRRSTTLDLLAFSARVLKDNWTEVEVAVRRGLKLRVVMFSPLEANRQYYEALESILGERNEKAIELENVNGRIARLRQSGALAGLLQTKLLSGKPLLHNMWVSDRGTTAAEAHVSFYAYGEMSRTPSFRSTAYSGDFVDALATEFDVVWDLSVPNEHSV